MTRASRNVARQLPDRGTQRRAFFGIPSAGVSWAGLASVIAVTSTLTTGSALAQNVPLPRAAPKERGSFQVSQVMNRPTQLVPSNPTNAPNQARQPQGNAARATPNEKPPEPFIPNPRRHAPASIFQTFDANQKAQAARVSAYLSSLNALTGNFVQVGPDGSRTTGDFYIQKPGKVRFEYDAPSPIAMIADGNSLAVRDRKLATQDIYPLSQTPLRYLLSERIDLLRETNVVAISGDDLYTSVTIEEKNPAVGTSRLMLMIGTRDGQLKQWTITDPQGYDTTVAIYNLDQSKRPDPSLFKIDFTRYPSGN